MQVSWTRVSKILTRCEGYLGPISSHSLQPYRGCPYGKSLCGVACYVQHNPFVTRGRRWGEFLEIRENAAEAYAREVDRERAWAHRQGRGFVIFCASSTDPFPPQERQQGITAALLRAMVADPPDELILQTHSPDVCREIATLQQLALVTKLRVHVTIEGDRDRLPGLPPPVATVARRLQACQELTRQGIHCLITMAPLHPLEHPREFLEQAGRVARGVVIDHYIGGDGSQAGQRTLRTSLPEAMRELLPESTTLAYRDEIVALARELLPGRVGVGQAGFAGELS